MSNIKAVIDIGTNTFHLLIAEVDEADNIEVIHKNTIPVKLGEGGVNKGYLADAAYKRGIEALITYRKELDEHGISEVLTTATAAVRDASNGQAFIAEAKAKANIEITLIDGLKEAEYIYIGAKGAGVLGEETSMIMDIGGGSVEFIICNNDKVFWKNSYQLGAARLLADFYEDGNPLADETIEKVHQLFDVKTKDLLEAVSKFKPIELIGTAGSFDSFACIDATKHRKQFNTRTDKEYSFKKSELDDLLEEIIKSSHEQREEIDGLVPLRIDMILMASLVTRYVIDKASINQIKTCTYSLKEGLILS